MYDDDTQSCCFLIHVLVFDTQSLNVENIQEYSVEY